jgi:hypothetical protein
MTYSNGEAAPYGLSNLSIGNGSTYAKQGFKAFSDQQPNAFLMDGAGYSMTVILYSTDDGKEIYGGEFPQSSAKDAPTCIFIVL